MQPQHADPPAASAGQVPLSPDPAADELVDLVRNSAGRIVVVLGPRSWGKSEFIGKRVLPRLEASGRTRLFECVTEIPGEALDAVSQPGTVVILDSFDRFLRLPETVREPALRALFTERRGATVVLVVGKSSLADLFDLRRLAPDILEHLFELEGIKLAAELPRYSRSGTAPLSWEPQLIETLEEELARLAEPTVTWSLVDLIVEGFRSGAYDPKRGLIGLLEGHLEGTLARVSQEPGMDERSLDVARAVLKQIAANGAKGTPSLAGVAERLDVPAGSPELCLKWLLEVSGLLKVSAGEGLVFQPPQLRVVLEQWLEEDRITCARAARYLVDGMEGRTKVGTLLPRERFNDIHAQRALLCTTREQASFMTQCALRFQTDRDSSAVDHWLRRIGDPTLEVSTLCETLADASPRARRRAAALLARMDEPRVHGHLCHTALEDDSPEVRQEAVESLSGFSHKGPIREVLTRAAAEGTGETRIRAIQALRIFRDENCARFLESIVSGQNEFAVREAAIRALALTLSETGAAALVRVALHDADEVDRDRACETLSDLGSAQLTEFGWNAALEDWAAGGQTPEGRWWKKLGHWPATLAVVVLSVFVHGLPLLIFRRRLAAAAFFAVQVACGIGLNLPGGESGWWALAWWLNWSASIAVGAWVARREQAPSGTLQRVLSNALLATTMLSAGLVLHGLGHWITRRRRQALKVFGIEAIAVMGIWPTFAFENAFNLGTGRSFFDTFTQSLLYMYRFGGIALSWVWAVSWLYMNERWGRRGPWLSEPHSRVLRALLKAPESAIALRRNLVDPAKAGVARMLLERFGDAVPGIALLSILEQDALDAKRSPAAIVQCLSRNKDQKGYETIVAEAGRLFDGLQPGQREQLIELLIDDPTESSILCLSGRRDKLRRWDRFRLLLAAIRRPFLGWHWAVRLATSATALLGVLLVVDGIRTSRNPGWPQIKELRRLSSAQDEDGSKAVATIAGFLADFYPASSVTELTTVFGQVRQGEVHEMHAPGLAESLGRIATSDARKDGRPCQQQSDPASLANAGPRTTAVAALVETVMGGHGSEMVPRAAFQALHDAAERGGSVELVCGLSRLFDWTVSADARSLTDEQNRETQMSQGRVAAMLAAVSTFSPDTETASAARHAITERVGPVAALLRTSTDPEVRGFALGALEASASDVAVDAIKSFILLAPRVATASGEPPTQDIAIQRDTRAMGVDSLRKIQTPAAAAAFAALQNTPGLPADIARKLKIPFGHEAAVSLNDEAMRLQQSGDMVTALQKARDAVEADGEFADARGTLGSILYQTDHKDEALRELRVATEKEPSYAWAHYMQALIHKEKQQFREAEAASGLAVESDPTYPWTYQLLGEIYHEQNRDRDAVAELRRLQGRYPEVGAIYAQLAYIYHEWIAISDASAYELAYDANQKLLALAGSRDPDQALSAEMNLVECRLTTGRYKELVQRVPDLLPRISSDADQRMTVQLLLLAAQVLAGDNRGALNALSELQATYDREFRPTQKQHNWVYDGTIAYLDRRPRNPQTTAVLNLFRAVNDREDPRVIPQRVFDDVRKAIAAREERGR